MSEWVYKGSVDFEVPTSAVGFIYEITRIADGKKYIGKKLLTSAKTQMVKGKKKKQRVESDWKTYFGSNSELKEEVKATGANKFHREILMFCYSKTECNYEETRVIFERRALFQDAYYNSWVTCKITKAHLAQATKKNSF